MVGVPSHPIPRPVATTCGQEHCSLVPGVPGKGALKLSTGDVGCERSPAANHTWILHPLIQEESNTKVQEDWTGGLDTQRLCSKGLVQTSKHFLFFF